MGIMSVSKVKELLARVDIDAIHQEAIDFSRKSIEDETAKGGHRRFLSHLQICGLEGPKGKPVRVVVPIEATSFEEANECVRQASVQCYRMDIVPFAVSLTCMAAVNPPGEELSIEEAVEKVDRLVVLSSTLDSEHFAASEAHLIETGKDRFLMAQFNRVPGTLEELSSPQVGLFFMTWLRKVKGESDEEVGVTKLEANVIHREPDWKGGSLFDEIDKVNTPEIFRKTKPSNN